MGFESRIVGKGVARTYAFETLLICSFLRGLSVRDVEAALEETFDEHLRSPLLRLTASRGHQRALPALVQAAVGGARPLAPFCHAVYLKLHRASRRRGVLVACGVTLEGRRCCSTGRSSQSFFI